MASSVPAKKGVAYAFYVSLVSQTDTKVFQVNPTLATGDVKVCIDDGAPANLATLPVVDADHTKRVKVSLSAAEMTGDHITVLFADAAGAEWCDLMVEIETTARTLDDGVMMADGVAHGGTPGSSTATLALSRVNITNQSANGNAFILTNVLSSESVVSVNAITANCIAVEISSVGAAALSLYAGGDGWGVVEISGGAGSFGFNLYTTDEHAVNITAAGVGKHDVNLAGSGTIDGTVTGIDTHLEEIETLISEGGGGVSITRSTGALIGTAEGDGVDLTYGTPVTSSEVDVLGDNTSTGILHVYASFTQDTITPNSFTLELFRRRVSGQAYNNLVAGVNVAGTSNNAVQRVYVGSFPASRYMVARVTATKQGTALTEVAILYELEKTG